MMDKGRNQMLFGLSIIDMGYDSLGFCVTWRISVSHKPRFMAFVFRFFSLMFLLLCFFFCLYPLDLFFMIQ